MKKKYDSIIIGAGVGGLVAGCYLAKGGLKTLIIEQHDKPGGYCTSFLRKGYRFDVGIHYFGGIKDKFFGKILDELELNNVLKLRQFDPTDKIIMPDNITYIRANLSETISSFKKSFPNDKMSIDKFFKFITQDNFFDIYKKCKTITFQEVLDHFFANNNIKSTLEVLLSNIGLPATQFSAISAIILYRDYILDGGYYPENGMQGFSDALASTFTKYGGDLILNKKVAKIVIDDSEIRGILLENGEEKFSNYIISNIDATQTFNELLRDQNTREKLLVNKLIVSPSIFSMYLGTDQNIDDFTKETCNIWSFDTYNVTKCLANLKESLSKPELPFIMISLPSAHINNITEKNTVQLFLIAPFESNNFWKNNRGIIEEKMLKKVAKILPNLIPKVKISATPLTYYRYTLNKNGAAFGWSSTKNQTDIRVFPQNTTIKNLFLVGHWCTIGSGQGGIPKVAFSGRKIAKQILQNINK